MFAAAGTYLFRYMSSFLSRLPSDAGWFVHTTGHLGGLRTYRQKLAERRRVRGTRLLAGGSAVDVGHDSSCRISVSDISSLRLRAVPCAFSSLVILLESGRSGCADDSSQREESVLPRALQ